MAEKKQIQISNKELHAFASQLVARMSLASRVGSQQYGGDRDIYKALGYMDSISYGDYFGRYERQDIAKAIIDRPVQSTWQGKLELVEVNDDKKTEFEKKWDELDKEFGLKTRLARVDRLTGIGRYGVLLLGLDDVKDKRQLKNPVRSGKRQLRYVKPFGEGTAQVSKYIEDPSDVRYGYPEFYNVEIVDLASKVSQTVQIHHSRIVHLIDNPLESEIYGTPRLQAVFNRLMDIEKIAGGDAEMFWRGARPGYYGKVDPEYQLTEAMKDGLKDQIDEYEHDLRRIMVNEGVDLDALAQQIADPAGHIEIQLQMISAETGIPQRILTGSERGELASSQDRAEWLSFIQTRRLEHAEPRIVRPFVKKLMEYGILPNVDDYTVMWADLFAQSEKARVEIGKDRSLALRDYTLNPMAEAIVPPKAFMQFFLGMTTEQIDLINEMRAAEISDEKVTQAILDGMEPTGGNGESQREDALEPERDKTQPPGTPKKEKSV